MATPEQVKVFLNEFFAKKNALGIVVWDRDKNTQLLLDLEMTRLQRDQIIDSLEVQDYCKGPTRDTLHKGMDMWEFGKTWRKQEIYIKISMGVHNAPVVCISFHEPERAMKLPFKKSKP